MIGFPPGLRRGAGGGDAGGEDGTAGGSDGRLGLGRSGPLVSCLGHQFGANGVDQFGNQSASKL